MVNKLNQKKAVFLDRDGVINKCILKNQKCFAPRKLKDFKLYPYTEHNIRKLKQKNFLTFIVSNQPDIGNGITKAEVVFKMKLSTFNFL